MNWYKENCVLAVSRKESSVSTLCDDDFAACVHHWGLVIFLIYKVAGLYIGTHLIYVYMHIFENVCRIQKLKPLYIFSIYQSGRLTSKET